MNTLQSIRFPDASMLRASSYGTILARCGRILDPAFKTKNGAHDLYQESFPVDHIDAFISHNCGTKRFAKLFTLALYFNLRLALSLSLLAAMAMAALVTAGVVAPRYA